MLEAEKNRIHCYKTIFLLSLRRVVGGKKIYIVSFLCLLPILDVFILFLAGRIPPGNELVNGIAIFNLEVLMPIVALVFGVSIFKGDFDDNLIQYYIVRPIPKISLIIFKILGAIPVIIGMLTITLFICFLIIIADKGTENAGEYLEIFLPFLFVVLIGALVYNFIFTFLSILTRWAFIIGLIYTLMWEVVISKVPTFIRYPTVLQHLRTLLCKLSELEEFEKIYSIYVEDCTILEASLFLAGFSVLSVILSWVILVCKDFTTRSE